MLPRVQRERGMKLGHSGPRSQITKSSEASRDLGNISENITNCFVEGVIIQRYDSEHSKDFLESLR